MTRVDQRVIQMKNGFKNMLLYLLCFRHLLLCGGTVSCLVHLTGTWWLLVLIGLTFDLQMIFFFTSKLYRHHIFSHTTLQRLHFLVQESERSQTHDVLSVNVDVNVNVDRKLFFSSVKFNLHLSCCCFAKYLKNTRTLAKQIIIKSLL